MIKRPGSEGNRSSSSVASVKSGGAVPQPHSTSSLHGVRLTRVTSLLCINYKLLKQSAQENIWT